MKSARFPFAVNPFIFPRHEGWVNQTITKMFNKYFDMKFVGLREYRQILGGVYAMNNKKLGDFGHDENVDDDFDDGDDNETLGYANCELLGVMPSRKRKKKGRKHRLGGHYLDYEYWFWDSLEIHRLMKFAPPSPDPAFEVHMRNNPAFCF